MLNKSELQKEISNLDAVIKELDGMKTVDTNISIKDILDRANKIEDLKIKRGARLLLLDEIDKEGEFEKKINFNQRKN